MLMSNSVPNIYLCVWYSGSWFNVRRPDIAIASTAMTIRLRDHLRMIGLLCEMPFQGIQHHAGRVAVGLCGDFHHAGRAGDIDFG